MSQERVAGGCACGSVRFEVALPSRFCAHCHCQNCRRAHGAAFVTYAGFQSSQFAYLEGLELVSRYTTDTGACRSFCQRCGTTFAYEGPRWEGEVHLALACLDGAIDRQPGGHVYVDHKAAWWPISDDLPQYGGTTGVEPRG